MDEHRWQRVGEKVAVGVKMEHQEQQRLDRLQVPEVGDLLDGRYRVQDVIATGGMGVILRAEQLPMERPVALKLLHPHIAADSSIVERFEREVRLAKLLNHPNTIRLYDFGESDRGLIYVAMELLDGMDLKRLLQRQGGLRVGRALAICRQMLDGLAEAHAHDFIHRDLKPSNVFITKNRRGEDVVKLLDFGIAKSLSDGSDLTGPGSICGTPSYVAPEYLMQEEARKPSDVYAVGLILLEMLTGRKVFRGETPVQTMMMHLKLDLELPAELQGTALGEVIVQATAKDPRARYRDAEAMYKAICAASEQISSELLVRREDLPDFSALVEEVEEVEEETLGDEQRRAEDHTIVPSSSASVGAVVQSVALVVVAALILGAGLFWMLDPGRAPELTSTQTSATQESSSLRPTADQRSTYDEMSPLDRSADAGSRAATTRRWSFSLDTDPSGAAAIVGGQEIGRTPLSQEFSPAELPKTVRFELDGYQPHEVELSRTSSPIVVEVLEALEEPEEPRASKRRAESAAPATESSSELSNRRIEEVMDQYLLE